MRYGWLLFDADGTLFDYDWAEGRALEAALAEAGFSMLEDTREIYRRVNAAAWRRLEEGTIDAATLRYQRFEELFSVLGVPVEKARAASEHYLVELAAQGRLLPGAEELIRGLARSVQLAIITNGLADVQRPRLGSSPIARFFRTMTISDEIGIAKPDPRIIDRTLAALGDPPKREVLIIGDSLSSDIQGGHNAGIDTCWFNRDGAAAVGEPRPHHTIQALDELPAVVEGLRPRS